MREQLGRTALLADLSLEIVEQLAAASQISTYRRGDVLMSCGEPGETLHIVVAGKVKVIVPADTGDVAVVAILGPGDFVGELSMIDGGPRSATIEAIDSVRTIVVARPAFQKTMRAYPALMERLLRILAGRLRQTTLLATDLAFLDLRGQVAKRLLDLAAQYGRRTTDGAIEISLPLTQVDLAAMIGGTRESVNKQLSWFEQNGAIERRGRQIYVRDEEQLRRRIT
ncbi:MAG: family transcriptional regulator, cyclic receptor protein [Chloroflexota bacterium]|jgi:CRP-like cAMP-binding protein|nr:family transcriptional regulator, cyclic receptor protein [Chloroflexota bacterium]